MLTEFYTNPLILDRLRVFTPLGIRFWDPVLDRQITMDLQVLAYPVTRPSSIVHARKTASGNYAFHKLPGLSAFTVPDDNASPPQTKPYILLVIDRSGQYTPVALSVRAPHEGLLFSGLTSSGSPGSILKGLYLYSTPSRSIPRWLAAVRGSLHDESLNIPAAHAVVKVTITDGSESSYYGIADSNGEFVVQMPYPTTHSVFFDSPAGPGGTDLLKQQWGISVEVLYAPAMLEEYPEPALPDYLSVLTQQVADIRLITLGASTTQLATELIFDQQLVLRTAGDSKGRLRISPKIS